MKEGMIANQIKKVTEAEIMDAAFKHGRKIAKLVNASIDSSNVHDIENEFRVKVYPLKNGDSLLMEIEKQLIEAYTSAPSTLSLSDNIQKIGDDSLLYTIPVMDTLPDGSTQFRYALGILMPKKEVILSIENK